VTPIWQLLISGTAGSSLTYAVTYVRERKRTQDAYRAPQRQAIGDIIAAGHELQLRVLDWCRVLTDLVEEIRQDRADNLLSISAQIRETESAYAAALLEMRRAFEVGSLTIVDVPCWQDMAVAAGAFSRFDHGPNAGISSADEAEQFVAQMTERASQLRGAISGLTKTATQRVTPAESRRNRRQRRDAQRQLAAYLAEGAAQTPDGGQHA